MDQDNPNPNRRKFLRRSLLVLGTAAGGAAIKTLADANPAASQPSTSAAANPGSPGPLTPALTPGGQVVHVHVHGKPLPGSRPARQGVPNRKWIMVIDLAKCDGCAHCSLGCSKMHFVPPDRQWIKVLRMRDSQFASPYYFPQPCYHCDNPPCTKVCPVDATFKRTDGTVLIDNERCIGCRFCMAACPYGARSFNWGPPADPPDAAAQPYSAERGLPRRMGTVEKCDFCPDMAAAGQLPACVTSCPMGVIYYGDQNEDAVTNSQGQTLQLSKLLRDNAGYRHLEELGTEPRVYYLPPKNRIYPAPEEGK